MEGWADGRLMRLDIATGKVEVIMRNLAFANGVALSKDKSFLIVCETTRARCMRYWIKGPKAGSSELFLDLPGLPDNIRLNPRGRFWIALHAKRGVIIDILTTRPWLRRIMMRLPLEVKILYGIIIGAPHGYLIEVDENGEITEVLEDSLGLVVRAISEVEERGGRLWMGSVIMPHVAVVDYPVKVKLPGSTGSRGRRERQRRRVLWVRRKRRRRRRRRRGRGRAKQRMSCEVSLLRVLEDSLGLLVREVEERLWMGSVIMPHVWRWWTTQSRSSWGQQGEEGEVEGGAVGGKEEDGSGDGGGDS
ncbi:hypothetical protein CLOP_g16622 [Closterium sp. NIES-67]|nr:hypothetical protein CLOP_g16622 [Closterium sp. NIES-67]